MDRILHNFTTRIQLMLFTYMISSKYWIQVQKTWQHIIILFDRLSTKWDWKQKNRRCVTLIEQMDYFNSIDIDSLLLDISLRDDKHSFQKLFESCYAPLCLFAKRYIEDLNVREDIVQEVFFRLWEKRKNISVNTSTRNYLIACVKNICLNQIKREYYKEEIQKEFAKRIPLYSNDTDNMYSYQELSEKLRAALDKLPVEYRIAFEMSKLENRDLGEIASVLNVSTRTVERYRDKSIQILKEELKDFLPLFIYLFLDWKWSPRAWSYSLSASEKQVYNHSK